MPAQLFSGVASAALAASECSKIAFELPFTGDGVFLQVR
jgi:hypothetical protein